MTETGDLMPWYQQPFFQVALPVILSQFGGVYWIIKRLDRIETRV